MVWAAAFAAVVGQLAGLTEEQVREGLRAYDSDDFWGPKLLMADDCLVIGGRSLALSRVKEIRFSIVTEIFDGIAEVDQQIAVGHIYGMDGRLVRSNATTTEGLPKGMYIMNGKKVVVK